MVIDTDGSAFITKAEFDSLKNNFQAQIDSYNSSIDSKIDGAIASYLSGIQVATEFPQIIPWASDGVRFVEVPDLIRFDGPKGFYYLPYKVTTVVRPFSLWLFGLGSDTTWSSGNKQKMLKNIYVDLSASIKGTGSLSDMDKPTIKKIIDHLGMSDVRTAIKTVSKQNFYDAWKWGWCFNVILLNKSGSYLVWDGMGFMDGGCSFAQTIIKADGTPNGYAQAGVDCKPGWVDPNGDWVDIKNISPLNMQIQSSMLINNSNYAFFLPKSNAKINCKLVPSFENGTFSCEWSFGPLRHNDSSGYSISLPSGTWLEATGSEIGEYDYLKHQMQANWCNALEYATEVGTFRTYESKSSAINTLIPHTVVTPAGGAVRDAGNPACVVPDDDALFARDGNNFNWTEDVFPSWQKGVGPRFSNINDCNADGSFGLGMTWNDKLYQSDGEWSGRAPDDGDILADGANIGALPVYHITPKSTEYYKVKDFYAPIYATDTMSQYGKSYLDGACICKTSNEGTLTIKLKTTDNTTLYLNKNAFDTAAGSGNIAYTINGTACTAGTGVPVNANESVTIVIKDVLAEEKYYVKPGDATTIQFESAVITQDN